MNRFLVTILLSCFALTSSAQDSVKLKILIDSEQYDEAIKYASQSAELSARALYLVGAAYYMKEDFVNSQKFIDLSLAKNGQDSRTYFFKAYTLNYLGKYEEAIPLFKTAITLKGDDADYYSGLGDSYYQLKQYDQALQAFIKSSELPDVPDHALIMIPDIYVDLGQNDKALAANYNFKSKISKQSGDYNQLLYNIGLLEFKAGNFDKSEAAFQELITLNPEDYHCYAKLIQICYQRKEYDKAKPYRDKLYEANKKGELKGNMKDMFCFDQFKWNDKLIQVFERYQEGPKDKIYNKHIFYVVNKNDSIELRIQTEFSPPSLAMGGSKYLLCGSNGLAHINYGIGFNDDFKYEDLKNTVIKILEKKYIPVATTTVTVK
jgi:tetratricopeptide (TPR) repeat protein